MNIITRLHQHEHQSSHSRFRAFGPSNYQIPRSWPPSLDIIFMRLHRDFRPCDFLMWLSFT
jgi:hypothetical protein